MPKPRKSQVALDATPYYHCTVRCVRRAFLCGTDTDGHCYDYRKQWLVSRLRFLSYVYAIDICAYAVMSNHYHVVLHVDTARAKGWTEEEVVERWLQLCSGTLLVNRWLKDKRALSEAELTTVEETIALWRSRLMDISWFMRHMNETIARMANKEDRCTGRFWEGRFKSQALLDEAALLSCMVYVDLNPIRAGMADDVASSDFTSIQQRLMDYANERGSTVDKATKTVLQEAKTQQQQDKRTVATTDLPEAPLLPFDGSAHTSVNAAIPFSSADYFQLVDETGRCIRDDKRGFIPQLQPKLIQQCRINPDDWLKHIQQFGKRYGQCVGGKQALKAFAKSHQQKWVKGIGLTGVG